eukprot:CAMPEP_0114996686 /NCGR_PEP_ID=MMETSP0216-20121206/14464_1 /TAXON_ID=223996 /ORGANISM="Protocruzia adherens, Strain Boccale" /LENGTH=219 /DNA_ID=CAMNT_0002360949 /DNA_START=44 /DNA_END=703 /DNA_ORIENTATION=+
MVEGSKYTNNADFLALKETVLKEGLEILDAEWTEVSDKKGMKTMDRAQDYEGNKMRGCETVMADMTWESFSKLSWDETLSHEGPKSGGKNILETTLLEEVDEDCRVFYQLVKPPFPLSKREFVYLVARKQLEDGRFLLNYRSVDHSTKPADGSNVRGMFYANAFIGKDTPEGLHIKFGGAYDPMGSVPGAIKKMAATDSYDRIKDMSKFAYAKKKDGTI